MFNQTYLVLNLDGHSQYFVPVDDDYTTEQFYQRWKTEGEMSLEFHNLYLSNLNETAAFLKDKGRIMVQPVKVSVAAGIVRAFNVYETMAEFEEYEGETVTALLNELSEEEQEDENPKVDFTLVGKKTIN